ncbi:MAG: bifunctional phosphoserine phosphatase/homoserine phosphotransferase ThrH [Neisseria sp.]|nr:bifunctional phosphoserine phosphatase/homoserine phosphotransferase ThrH [Neisseria sp.]
MQRYAFLDLEGVLYPELWEIYAEELALPALAKTTREEPDYHKLVRERIALLGEHGIGLARLAEISDKVGLLAGAADFVRQLQQRGFIVCVVTDAFQEIIGSAVRQLGIAEIYPNRFVCDDKGRIVAADYARKTGKHEVLQAKLHGKTQVWSMAVGDTFNDFSMLEYADCGFLFRPSDSARQRAAASFRVTWEYREILAALDAC